MHKYLRLFAKINVLAETEIERMSTTCCYREQADFSDFSNFSNFSDLDLF